MPSVARSLEMSPKTLANWVYRARHGQALLKRPPVKPASDLFHFHIINAIIMTSHQSCEVINGPTGTRS